jgi:CHAT domain
MSVFEVGIGPGAHGQFRVDVVRSPAGEASESVRLDVQGVAGRRVQVQQALLASAATARRVLPTAEHVVREVGQELFRALLGSGKVAALYRASQAVTAERGQQLRLVVRIDSPQLVGLPWEAMYDEHLGAYLCRVGELVRHVPVPAVPAPLKVQAPLRILAVVSSPRGMPVLDVDKERDQLDRALAALVRSGLAEVCWAPSATWAGLQELLMDGPWHVVHYIGHGDFDPGLDEGILALERDHDGRLDRVAAHRVVDLLHQAAPMPRLVVLNSCSGGTAGAYDLFSGTAAALVRGGVSAVAAMQYEISDPAAVAFARGFYARLARGGGIDEAITSGRIAILGAGDSTMEWVTPVLYLRGDQTHLYAFAPGRTAGAPQLPQQPTDSPTQAARRPSPKEEGADTDGIYPFADNLAARTEPGPHTSRPAPPDTRQPDGTEQASPPTGPAYAAAGQESPGTTDDISLLQIPGEAQAVRADAKRLQQTYSLPYLLGPEVAALEEMGATVNARP